MEFHELAALSSGHVAARALQTAVKLGLFDKLAEAEATAAALAQRLSCEPRALALLANALVALELLEKRDDRYALAPVARRFLVGSAADYFGAMVLFEERLFALWARLEASVRSGRPARTADSFQGERGETELFIAAMDDLVRARGDARFLAERLDLGAVGLLADIGGGPGTYVVEFLRRWPGMRAVVYDLPGTLEVSRAILKRNAPWALDRLALREFDYHTQEIPEPADAILLSNVIHLEDEQTCALLAQKCFRALNPGGLILIKDHIMNEALTEPVAGALFSLQLLLTTRGRDYSFKEVTAWLARAGFAAPTLSRLPFPPFTSSVASARKPAD